jgi:thiol-disulfide isomerase/thioredoxin
VRTLVALSLLVVCVVVLPAQTSDLVSAVRAATGERDWSRAERLVAEHRAARGIVPENILAESWLGRGALAERRWEAAEAYARDAHTRAIEQLRGRPIDSDPFLPNAIGNAIDVLAQVAVERGERSDAVRFLQTELRAYRNTSIEKRIQKTLNLFTLEGTPAPALDLSEYIGARPPSLDAFKGQVVLLFFWAHWCADCKATAPVVAALYEKYKAQGLTIVAPTQRFGYVTGGATAGPDEEKRYIEEVRAQYYPVLEGLPIPLSAANHTRYGVSSTPTLALIDRQGIVRLYNPGRMTAEALDAHIRRLLSAPPAAR